MRRTGMLVILALLMAVLLLTCPFAAAENAGLEILSCEQQGSAVVLEFAWLDETSTPPLDRSAWTVRGEASLTDLRVESVSRYQGGTHYVFLYEASASVTEAYSLSKTIPALQEVAATLGAQDSMSLIQIGSKAEMLLSRTGDKAAMDNALKKAKKESSVQNVMLYDSIDQALGMIERRSGERTVLIILATGYDTGSNLARHELAQKLEAAQVSVYAVSVKGHTSKQNADNLEALCVRGGYLLEAHQQTNKQQMIDALTGLLPATREVYALTARATDASYNGLNNATLRVFAYQGNQKFSAEATLTTDNNMYTVVVATPTATAMPTEEPSAAPTDTPAPQVTAAPSEPTPEPEATTVASTEPVKAEALTQYAIYGGGALAALIVVILVIVLLAKRSRKKKARKKEENRPAASLKNNAFAPTMPNNQSTKETPATKPGAASTPNAEKPKFVPAKASKTAPATVEDPKPTPSAPPAATSQSVVTSAPVPSTDPNKTRDENQARQQVAALDKTMDERQARQQASALDKTMDERQARQQASELDKTMDERQARQKASELDKTMDERQARKVQPLQTPVESTTEPATVQPDPMGKTQLETILAPIPAADQTVVPVNRDPQLILTITDAHGTREASAPLVTGGEITIGRENTDILLDANDHSISRNHMSIRLTASKLEVLDHSGNGTQVDGRLLRRSDAKLTIGSVMELGGLDEAMPNRVKTVITVKGIHYPGGYR